VSPPQPAGAAVAEALGSLLALVLGQGLEVVQGGLAAPLARSGGITACWWAGLVRSSGGSVGGKIGPRSSVRAARRPGATRPYSAQPCVGTNSLPLTVSTVVLPNRVLDVEHAKSMKDMPFSSFNTPTMFRSALSTCV